MPPRRDSTITLTDGRRLAFTEWGDPDGKPLFLFHGAPFSRLFCPDEPATIAAGVRLVTVDRPGIGRSDVLEARSWGDWPADVVALADALGIDRFAAVAESVRQGTDGYRWEAIDAWLPWGFRLDRIPMRVHLWHGEQDPRVPRSHFDFSASRIPDSVVSIWSDAGHWGCVKHWDQILGALTPR